MAIQFPDAPTQGQSFVATNGVSYTYDNGGWIANSQSALDDRYVNLDGDTMTGDLTVPSLNGGPLAGFRNQLINGNFSVNQRGVNGPIAAYTADMWRPNTAQTLLQYKTINPGTNIPFKHHLAVSSSATQSILAQLIELPAAGIWGPFESGSTWTLSWYTQQDLTDIDIYVDFVDSSAGTNSQPCTVGTPQLIESGAWGSSFNRYSVEVTITGSIAATNECLRVYFVGTNSKAFDLALVQLEIGSLATPFEQRFQETELGLCQRYFQVSTFNLQTNAIVSGYVGQWVPFATSMRAVPTVAITQETGKFPANLPAPILVEPSRQGLKVSMLNTTGAAVPNLAFGLAWSADAEL